MSNPSLDYGAPGTGLLKGTTLFGAIAIALGAIGAGGCRFQGTQGRSRSQELHFQLSADPVSLDPTRAEDGISLKILGLTQDTLVRLAPDGEIVAGLAERWEWAEGGKKIKFCIRSDARWSDGLAVEASQFKLAFQRALDSQVASPLGHYLSVIRAAEADSSDPACRNGLVLRLDAPSAVLLPILAIPMMVPLREDVLAKNQGKWPAEAPGTGPYFVKRYVVGQYIEFERNPHQPVGGGAPGEVQPGALKGWIVTEEQTAMRLFDEGKLDWIAKIPGSELKRLKSQGALLSAPFWATYYLSFNFRNVNNPFAQSRLLREAFSRAIDRVGIQRVIDGMDQPSTGFVPSELMKTGKGEKKQSPDSLRGGKSDVVESGGKGERMEWTPKDWETARKEVKRFGLDRTAIEIGYDSSQRNSLIMEKIQMDLQSKLGLKLALRGRDWKSHIALLRSHAPAIYRMGWLAAFADPLSHLQVFGSGFPNNLSGYKNSNYDDWVTAIAKLAPSKQRSALVEKAHDWIINQDFAVVPIFQYVQTNAIQKRVLGFAINPMGVTRLDGVRLKMPKE